MKYYEVALVKSARSSTELLTYSSNNDLRVGEIALAPFRNGSDLALIVKEVRKPDFKTKNLGENLGVSIDEEHVALAQWISSYYDAPLAACLRLFVPSGIDVDRRNKQVIKPKRNNKSKLPSLNPAQKRALKVLSSSNDTSLLFGVTGSGKTRIYIEMAKNVQSSNKSSIILVPEISLTAQLVKEFENSLNNVFVTHSNMTPSQRHRVWQSIRDCNEAVVVIGPRSALFTPVSNLGLVVIDESHDDSYKQSTTPRYDARRVARKLCDIRDAKLVLGSATPSLADMYLAEKRNLLVELPEPVLNVDGRKVELIDMRDQKSTSPFSPEAINAMQSAIDSNEQVLVYHNRRGSAPVVSCTNCGWVATCSNCHIPMVLHSDEKKLKCHTCGQSKNLPTSCPECSHVEILFKGYGTKKIESELGRMFPESNIMRFDGDSKKSESMAEMYSKVHAGEVNIIVGTQMIAKGLDLPLLNTGIIVSADTGLSLPDYSTNERTFQLIHQVVGRIGRHSEKSYVGIQTRTPENEYIKLAATQNYRGFYEKTIDDRRQGGYPPFKHLLLLTCSYASAEAAKKAATELLQDIRNNHNRVEISGPAPAYRERQSSKYRWQLLVKSSRRDELVEIGKSLYSKRAWTIELDPVSLL